MIKLGLRVGIKNDKYPENLFALCSRNDMFQQMWSPEDAEDPDVNVFDILLLESDEQTIDILEYWLAKDPNVKFAERCEIEIK